MHTDAVAAASAQAVRACAYTVGNHMAFSAGAYRPGSDDGRRLIAHELAHTLQQRPALAAAGIPVGSVDDPAEHEAEAVARAVTAGGAAVMTGNVGPSPAVVRRSCGPAVPAVSCTRASGDVVGEVFRFVVSCDDLRPGEEARLRAFAAPVAAGDKVELHGFASAEGDAGFNENLSCARAQWAGVVLRDEGVTDLAYFQHGATGGDAPERRSVVIKRIPSPAPAPSPTPVTPSAPPPAFRCGPDVTAELTTAMGTLRSTFAGLTANQRNEVCDSLDSLTLGPVTWDVSELHNSDWIWQNYRPGCASVGGSPPCSHSVQVGNDCWYAGSANYVTFGVICDLCSHHYAGTSNAPRFTEAAMLSLINMYKGSGPSGTGTPSANFAESQLWARSGYHGWPAGGNPTGGDRNNCAPGCPTPFAGPTFHPRVCPHIDPLSTCPSGR